MKVDNRSLRKCGTEFLSSKGTRTKIWIKVQVSLDSYEDKLEVNSLFYSGIKSNIGYFTYNLNTRNEALGFRW